MDASGWGPPWQNVWANGPETVTIPTVFDSPLRPGFVAEFTRRLGGHRVVLLAGKL